MDVTSVTICLPVQASAASLEWYQALFGAEACISPAVGVVETEITAGTWLQLMDCSAGEEPANVLRVGVRNLDAELARLKLLGITFDSPIELVLAEGAIRRCYFNDPDGNRLCLYQLY
jgi:catechol 2,3-dioxygenase-like lactoylglutathione lyase family enzyme